MTIAKTEIGFIVEKYKGFVRVKRFIEHIFYYKFPVKMAWIASGREIIQGYVVTFKDE